MTDAAAPKTFDVAVIGAGPAGLAAGLACAELGLSTIVAGPAANRGDARSAALFHSSIQLLKRLDVWRDLEAMAEPLRGIRLIDATGSLLRAPEVTFKASEIGLDAFGYSLLNRDITAGLEAAAKRKLSRVVCNSVSITSIEPERVLLRTSDGEVIAARLIAAADGRGSAARQSARIDVKSWSYPQAAVVCNFDHDRPHHSVSTEWHRSSGPLTLVPAPATTTGKFSSSLVWVETPEEAQRLAALDDAAFTAALAMHTGTYTGGISGLTQRQAFPLSGQTAAVLGHNRVALIGEAGHVIPPIGAQGLNLSLRDGATLAEVAAAAKDRGGDPGDTEALHIYDRRRRIDVTSRVNTVDILNRSLITSFAPFHALRGVGLIGLSLLPPLRRALMREGVAPAFSTPILMRDFGAAPD